METPSASETTTGTKSTSSNRKRSFDRHLLAFFVRVIFGFLLAIYCGGCLVYLMVNSSLNEHDNCSTVEQGFATMYFSLLSFAAGYFLGATPGVKKKQTLLPVTSKPSANITEPPTPVHNPTSWE